MLFYKRIDRNKTIAKSKAVLEEYARLKKIVSNGLYDLDTASPVLDHQTFSSYVNFDAQLIQKINAKDRSYEEIDSYIQEIQNCINCLNPDEIEIINMKYVSDMTNQEVIQRLNSAGTIISDRQFARKMKEIYIDFAIAYGIYVLKASETEK